MSIQNPVELPILDDEQIEMLTSTDELGSADLLIELLELFEGESVEKMGEIRKEFPSGNAKVIEAGAHSIAGSGANLGCKRLWGIAKNLEASALAGDFSKAESQFDQMEKTYTESIQALRGVIRSLGGTA